MTAKTVNRLTQKQVWAISKHIEENIELYTNADYKFIANEMNKIFDYEITVSNIQHIKEVTGLQIGRPSKRNSPSDQSDIKYIASIFLSMDKWKDDARLLSIVDKK
jgi:DNA-binding cell septation regulator SpoVG